MRRTVLFAPLFVAAGILPLLSAQRPSSLAAGVFAIRDARVVMTPREVLEKGTVIIRDGIIEAVGKDVKVPADATVIDGSGKTVYPGFVDATTSTGYDATLRKSAVGEPLSEDLAASVLAFTKPDNRKGITPDFQVRSALKTETENLEGWRRVGVTARLVAPDGGILAGQSALVSLSGAAARDAVLVSPVGQHLAFLTATGNDYPRSLMGFIAHARQVLLDAGRHQKVLAAFRNGGGVGKRPPADPGLESLFPLLDRKMPVVIEADSKDEIHRALDFAAEFSMRPILLGGRHADEAVERLVKEKVPVLFRLDLSDEKSPRVQAAERNMPPRVKRDAKERRQREAAVPGVLKKKGVPFAFAAGGISGDKPWDTFMNNVRMVIAAGLSADDALTALTGSAAEILGASGQLGSVSKGKAAHLIVTDGDWDKKATRVLEVFVDGQRFSPDAGPAPKMKPMPPMKDDGEGEEAGPGAENDPYETELEADRKPATRTGGDIILRNATVLPVSGEPIAGADILIRKGKIAAVGIGLEAPKGVLSLDMSGMFIMPGIIDTHCHFAVSGGVNEMSLSMVPEVRIKDVLRSEDVQIYRSLAGGVTTARLLHGSANVIGGQDAVIKMRYGKTAQELLVEGAPRGVKFALGENVKRTDGRFPNTRMGVEAGLIRAFGEARDYARNWEEYKKGGEIKSIPPRRDLRLEALADVLSGDLRVHCHCYRADEILMLLRVADKFGVKIRSLQHVLEGYKVAPEIAKHGASCSPFSDWWAYKWEAADAIPYCAALLNKAGVSVCLKSDSNELMRHMYQEAAKVVKYGGVSEREALAMITLNPASQLGLEKQLGSIEVGKDADLAIFNGHPLNSYARVEMTLVDGEVYFERKGRKPFKPAAEAPVKRLTRDLVIKESRKNEYLIYGAEIHPVSGAVIAKGTIEIRKGRIVGVRPTTVEDRNTPDAINAAGMHIYPGLIDAGSIVGLVEVDSARETRDHAEGGDFQPDLKASTAVNPDSELIPVTRANGVLTVVTRPTGGIIAGQSALLNLTGWVPQEMALRDPLALHVELPGGLPGIGRGSPFGMARRGVDRKLRETRLKKLRDLFREALTHDQARKEKENTPSNPRLEALVPYASGTMPVIIQASRLEEIREAIKLAEELKIKVVLAGGIDSWKVAAELKKRDIAVILGPVLSLPYEGYDPYDATFTCAAKLHKAGVRFCIRSNGDSNTRNLPYHAAMAVSYGLPPEEGLKAVTLNAARILGVESELGSLEKGKLANLVFTSGDLLQASTEVAGLMISGKPMAAQSKQTRLYERYLGRLREYEKK